MNDSNANSSSRQSLITTVAIKRPLTAGFGLLFVAVFALTLIAGVLAVHSEREHKRAKKALYKTEVAVAQLREEVASLSARDEIREAQFATQTEQLSLLLADDSQLSLRWQQDRLEGLVLLAEQALALRGDVAVALTHLQAAEHVINRDLHAVFLPLQRALREDIDRLSAMPLRSSADVLVMLQQLAQDVERLSPLAEPKIQEISAAETADASAWAKGWEKIQRLLGLINESRVPEQEQASGLPAVKAQLSTRLLQAELALVRQDSVLFVHALAQFEVQLAALPQAQQAPLASALKALLAMPIALPPMTLVSRQALQALPALSAHRP